jgi:hypothetical protein
MERVPLDLRNTTIRNEYLEKHRDWFLQNHQNAIRDFEDIVLSTYPDQNDADDQMGLFESSTKAQKIKSSS